MATSLGLRGTLVLPLVDPPVVLHEYFGYLPYESSEDSSNQPTATSNARFWVWVHLLVNLVEMAFLFTMNLYVPWVLNFNLSQARLLKETACNYVFSVLVHGIPPLVHGFPFIKTAKSCFVLKLA